MKEIIIDQLNHIEKEYNMKIILACESGSRAWGFPSMDSDFDVRFIYVKNKEWYLTTGEKRDVIEIPIDAQLDINGWDLRKSLQLMRKSNAPLLEWLSSPIQYCVWPEAFEQLAALSKTAFLPATAGHHYLAMARKSIEKYKNSDKVRLKTYMYAIRPILCGHWIVQHLTHPPMHMSDLLAEVKDSQHFKDQVIHLIEQKKQHTEKHLVERIDTIETYIDNKLLDLTEQMPANSGKPSLETFDDVFRSILDAMD